MVDYVRLAATADRLITANGRSVTFQRLESTPADPAKPWDGPTDPRSPVAASTPANAVFVEPESATRLGLANETSELIKMSDQIALVAPPAGGEDLTDYDEVLDRGTTWKITEVHVLEPATTRLLYIVGVKR